MDSSRVESSACGPDAFILRLAERADETAFRQARQLVAELERCPLPGQAEVVPAFTTLLIRFEAGAASAAGEVGLAAFCARIRETGLPAVHEGGRLVEIPARYDGPDLARVAVSAGIPVAEEGGRAGGGVWEEAFADRGYAEDGSLIPRGMPGAMLTGVSEVAARAKSIAEGRGVTTVVDTELPLRPRTLCVHGDTLAACRT